MSKTAQYIEVNHGKLRVSVPRSMFRKDGSVDPVEERSFRELMASRYPWLNERSLDVLMAAAVKEYASTVAYERRGAPIAREIAVTDPGKAISYLKRHLEHEPQDAEAWYALGEVLCRTGRTEDGYQALKRGRELR